MTAFDYLKNTLTTSALAPFLDAGLALVPIPPINGKPTKGPRLKGWNLPKSADNPNGFVTQLEDLPKASAGFTFGLHHRASHTLALDLDNLDLAKKVFEELTDTQLLDWLESEQRVEVKSPKPNRGKLLFKLPEGFTAPGVKQCKKPKGDNPKDSEVVFELRCGDAQDVILGEHPDCPGQWYQLIGNPAAIPDAPPVLLDMLQNWDSWKKPFESALGIESKPLNSSPRQPQSSEQGAGRRDPITEFNQSYSVADVLIRNGYEPKGKDRFLRPGSESHAPGVMIMRNCADGVPRIYSHGGDVLNDNYAHDAFDCYRLLECAGDFAKALAWNPEITEHNRALYRADRSNPDGLAKACAVVDQAIADCTDNPGVLASKDFIAAVKRIRETDQEQWYDYRVKLKQAKPVGVLLSDIDKATAPPTESDNGDGGAASELVALVIDNAELFYDDHADGASYAAVTIKSVLTTLRIGSQDFVDWLSYAYYQSTKGADGRGKSASESAIKQASFALAGVAKHEGNTQRAYLRAAQVNDTIYLSLGNEALQAVEVMATGWRLLDQAPVKFWHPRSMQALPIPQPGGDLSSLWDFLNIPESERLLVLAWILEAFRPSTPFPILALSGPQGSAKSSTQNKLRQLIDNDAVNLRAAPKSTEDVFVSAGCNWLASFENISHLSQPMQDTLCTLATGGGYSARTLYTNADETIIEVKRPVIINSIPNVVTAQDLTDRAISVELPKIAYREEVELNAKWEAAKPGIFGALLDLFVATLARLPQVKLVNPPRMADFTRLGEAMAQALGHPAGTFDALYRENRADSVGRALEASPVGVAIREMADNHTDAGQPVFYGTVKNLYEILSAHYRTTTEGWPRSPKGLSEAIKRQAPALASLGIDIIQTNQVERTAQGRGLTVKILRNGNVGNIV